MNNHLRLLLTILTLCMSISHGAFAKSIDETSFYRNFEGIRLKDQNGQIFSLRQLEAKITIFNFIYTQCVSVCNVQTADFLKIYQALSPELKKDIRFVSISLDPMNDNPKKLKAFARKFNADVEGWFFLSTNFKDLNTLSSRISLFREDHGKTVYDALAPAKKPQVFKLEEHTTGLWLIDAEGHVKQRYVGNPMEVNRVANELNILHGMQFNQANARQSH